MHVVYEADTSIDAHLVKNLLDQAGIAAHIRGEHLGGAIGGLPAIGLIAVAVADEDQARARRIIEEWAQADIPAHDGSGDLRA